MLSSPGQGACSKLVVMHLLEMTMHDGQPLLQERKGSPHAGREPPRLRSSSSMRSMASRAARGDGGAAGGPPVGDRVLSQLLVEMDGLQAGAFP